MWLGFTPRPEMLSNEDSEGDKYQLATEVKKREKSNRKIPDDENTEIEKGAKEKNKRKGKQVGYKRSRGSKKGKK